MINLLIVFGTMIGGCTLFLYNPHEDVVMKNKAFKGEFLMNEDYGLDIFMIMYGTANTIMCFYSMHKYCRYLNKVDGPIPNGSMLRK